MSDLHDEIVAIVYKHLPGKHNQKRHGWRYGGGVDSARRSMRGEKDPKERAEYRKRAGMSEPKKVDRKPETKDSVPDGWQDASNPRQPIQYSKFSEEKYFDSKILGPGTARKLKATILKRQKDGSYSVQIEGLFGQDKSFSNLKDAVLYANKKLSGDNGLKKLSDSIRERGKRMTSKYQGKDIYGNTINIGDEILYTGSGILKI